MPCTPLVGVRACLTLHPWLCLGYFIRAAMVATHRSVVIAGVKDSLVKKHPCGRSIGARVSALGAWHGRLEHRWLVTLVDSCRPQGSVLQ